MFPHQSQFLGCARIRRTLTRRTYDKCGHWIILISVGEPFSKLGKIIRPAHSVPRVGRESRKVQHVLHLESRYDYDRYHQISGRG